MTFVRLLAGLLVVLPAALGTLVLTAGPGAAGCAAEPSAEQLGTSDVAFSGVVTARRESGDDLITTVRVDRVFKGDVTRRVDVVSPADEVDSSMTAVDNDRLIVFGQLDDAEVSSSLCRSVIEGTYYYSDLLADLGEGTEPTPGYLKAERRTLGLSYDQFVAGRAVLGVLGLSFLTYFAYRAWRARRRTG